MRKLNLIVRAMALGLGTTAICAPMSIAVASPAASVAGSWKGPFLSTNFVFEFSQAAGGWTGRYRSEKSGKWADLQTVSVTDGTVRFKFESQPPSTFSLTLDAGGKTLTGTARFGEHAALPLALTRAS